MIQETQRTGYNLNITNFQLEELQRIGERLINDVRITPSNTLDILVDDLIDVIDEISKGNSNAKETQ